MADTEKEVEKEEPNFSEENTQEKTNNISQLIYIAQMLANDLKHIQFHAIGPYLDNIQNITKELYNELNCEIDELMIEAITHGLAIHNFSDIKSQVGEEEYQPLEGEMFDWNLFCQELSDRGGKYLKALCDSELPGFVKDPYIEFWNKEINFKASLRALDLNPTCEENEQVGHSVLEPYFLSDGLPANDVDNPNEPLPAVDWRDVAKGASWGSDIGSLEKKHLEEEPEEENAETEDTEDNQEESQKDTENTEEKDKLKESVIEKLPVLYHGCRYSEAHRDYAHYNCFYVTPSFAYAALYSCDENLEHGCVYEMYPKRPLNIFDASNGKELIQLKSYLERQDKDAGIDWKKLATGDWLEACGGDESIRDYTIIETLQNLGYDGYINREFEMNSESFADGQGGAGLLKNTVSLGIFDVDSSLEFGDRITYDEYFTHEDFKKCYDADMAILRRKLKTCEACGVGGFETEDFVIDLSEELPFLDTDEVTEIIEDYNESHGEDDD